MEKLITVFIAALCSTVTFSTYAADQPSDAGAVQVGAPEAEGRGDPSGAPAAGGGAVEEGVPAPEGRGDPSGEPVAGDEPVTSPIPTGPGRQ